MIAGPECRALASVEFSAILAADPEILRLRDLQYDRQAEFLLLVELLRCGAQRIGRMPLFPMTLARWSLLALLENPFVAGGKFAAPADADLFLGVLAEPDLRKLDCDLSALPGRASGLTGATGLPFEEVCAEIQTVARNAFLPLAMLPPGKAAGSETRYDADWVTNIASIAARKANAALETVIHDMPLSVVCGLYVAWRRQDCMDGDQVCRRPNEEIAGKIMDRTLQLGEEFLKRKQGRTAPEKETAAGKD